MQALSAFLRRLISVLRLAPGRDELSGLLSQANPHAPLEARVEWLESLLNWIRTAAINPHAFTQSGQLHAVRLRFIFHLLQRNPQWKTAVAETLRSLVMDTDTLSLFCQSGLNQEKGFFFEALDRSLHRLLPAPPRPQDAATFFARVLNNEDDAVWIENLPEELLGRLVALVRFGAGDTPESFARIQRSMLDALVILSANVASLGSASEIRSRLPHDTVTSPFLRLSRKITIVFHGYSRRKALIANSAVLLRSCLVDIEACRLAIDQVFAHLEKSGVSVSLVYSLERQLNALRRCETLIQLLTSRDPQAVQRMSRRFLAALVRERRSARSIRELVRSTLHLLARKIVERTGATGEHYITRTRAEYFDMLKSAAGGGFVTVGTTLGKMAVGKLHAPMFFDGLFTWINYSGSFLLMQFAGFTLATKQASMTASSLAGKLRDLEEEEDAEAFVTEVSCLTRSQLAAAIGNVGMAVPCAIALDTAVLWLTNRHLVPLAYSDYLMHSLNPFTSLTIPLAAFTGVLLWVSSVAAGWLENWVVYHQVPEALANHRFLRKLLGPVRSRKVADWFLRNVSGIGGNTALGFLLAFPRIAGSFFGVPLDVRHVTLSSVALAFSACTALSAGADPMILAGPALGIAVIGLLNFGVSFVCALFVALRAREVRPGTLGKLAGALGNRFRTKPREFFYPDSSDLPLPEKHPNLLS